ncbi:bifunctional phosphopantothenoylcysteine decarboxylase/phosphopantothenate synthase [Nesterenkonia sp. AY15]|uniref:bifunctional phosphopantothenoylcysteine decarboxylase/phosphopantothenate synthase n=1 Tax=Nesterenkonia sp. AY15 TaxID=2901139 RepID=UPI001F4C96B2|nr:bifunctional phosphopantothenoylcysteine decarboxylase/phosphopantothenate synthase [Nesterenkonia sp. AY15]MCH8571788.1 bifunctional phosphopantothenoylcysteine decarboxylase/phosphopantothenate synthase [Nesterenkonia sp. AY15]
MRIVLGVSAGIAAYKAVHLLRLMREAGHQVDVIPTPASEKFVGRATWEAISGRPVTTSVFSGVDEVRHVRLGQEADLVVVAPATADLLARARAGMADDLLTTTLLASEAPTLLVPAMHTEMWNSAATTENVEVLRTRGIEVMEPAVGRLTGKDTGPGRLPEPEEIYARVTELLHEIDGAAGHGTPEASASAPDQALDQGPAAAPTPGRLRGRTVVITAGGTREPLDPVRYLGNRSSGKQGMALAETAAAAGAKVHLIAGTMDVRPPAQLPNITVEHIETAAQLQAAVQRAAPAADMLIMAAAVADFRPAAYAAQKIKKTEDGENPVITLERTPDILAETVQHRRSAGTGPAVIVGFAAETGSAEADPLELARAKLLRKGCDLLVLNQVGETLVFGRDETEIHILTPPRLTVEGSAVVTLRGTKHEAAEAIIAAAAAYVV